jgi:CubicO group peptidase (beta-lactamase class C family)
MPSTRQALLFVSILPACLLAASATGRESDPLPDHLGARIDEYVRQQMRRQKVPGLSLAIVKDGQVLKATGYGLANVEHEVPARPETVYQAGSVGKQFTAAAVLLLAQDGKLNLDAPVGKYLDAPPLWKAITVRHLLNHTSGLKEYSRKEVDRRKDHTDQDLLRIFANFPLDFPPGARYRYSDTGYVVLGMLITRLAGEHHGAFLRKRILQPLGMSATRIISEADIVRHRAAGYRLLHRQLKNQEWVAPSLNTLADGCLYTTVLDLAKWDAALYNRKLLTRASLAQMWAPAKLANGKTHPYGFGWKLGTVGKRRVLEHRGSWQGFRAYIGRYVEEKLSVIVLTNLASASPERIAKEALGVYRPELAPPVPKVLTDPEPATGALVRAILKELAAKKFRRDRFTPEASKEITEEDEIEWHEILGNVGPLASLVLVERKLEKGTPRCLYVADFGEVSVRVGIVLTKTNKIAELSLYQY